MVQLTSFVLASLVAVVSAHQNLHEVYINGVSPGYQVGIRMPPSNSPVTDVTSNDLACNVGGTSGAGVATLSVNAGDRITVQWDQSTHPGPITHFLYGPVASAAGATGLGSWAKIDELDYVNGEWANQIMSAVGMKYNFTLPTGIASGEYLLRSEMLALHASTTLRGAQFYIGCIQLKITNVSGGGGTCSPKIQLPGAYKATDPNILIPNFYYGFVPATYTAPGGPVATCGSGGGSPPVTTTRAATTAASTTTARATSTPVATTSRIVTASTTRAVTSSASSGVGAPLYGQCGGMGWTGPTTCTQGKCVASNVYYSQCVN